MFWHNIEGKSIILTEFFLGVKINYSQTHIYKKKKKKKNSHLSQSSQILKEHTLYSAHTKKLHSSHCQSGIIINTSSCDYQLLRQLLSWLLKLKSVNPLLICDIFTGIYWMWPLKLEYHSCHPVTGTRSWILLWSTLTNLTISGLYHISICCWTEGIWHKWLFGAFEWAMRG